jgi:choline dehydrogenase-like flavoprotein
MRRALVVGAGIAGIQVALDIANSGYEVVLVERLPSIGGHMAQLSETFPTLDCSQCILTPRTVEVGHHPNIKLMTYSEVISVESVDGESGKLGHREAGEQVTNLPIYQSTRVPRAHPPQGSLRRLESLHRLRGLPGEVSHKGYL